MSQSLYALFLTLSWCSCTAAPDVLRKTCSLSSWHDWAHILVIMALRSADDMPISCARLAKLTASMLI